MTPLESFQEGKLGEAIQAQDRLVLSHPSDSAARLLLCEFLLFNGNLDAVRGHLDQLPCDSAEMNDYLDAYRQLLDAEAMRRRVLFGPNPADEPLFLLDVPEPLRHRLDALRALRTGDQARAVESLDHADALLEEVVGHVDGREFQGVSDGDDLFAPILEVLIDGQYAWFSFDQIDRLELGPLESLRDHLFVPATLRARAGEEWHVHLPALYPNSHAHEDEEIRSGQATDWFADEDGPIRGVGLRVFTFGEEELMLLDFTLWER